MIRFEDDFVNIVAISFSALVGDLGLNHLNHLILMTFFYQVLNEICLVRSISAFEHYVAKDAIQIAVEVTTW